MRAFNIFILIVCSSLVINSCKREEGIKPLASNLNVFNSDGRVKATKDGGFIFVSGSEYYIKLDKYDKAGIQQWSTDISGGLTHYPGYQVIDFSELNEGGFVFLSSYEDTIYGFTFLKIFTVNKNGAFLGEKLSEISFDIYSHYYSGLENDGSNNFYGSLFIMSNGLSCEFFRIDTSSGIMSRYSIYPIIENIKLVYSKGNLMMLANDFMSGNKCLLKYDTSGTLVFNSYVQGPLSGHNRSYQTDIIPYDDGSCILAGHTYAARSTYDFYLQKYSTNGTLEWKKYYGTGLHDYLSIASKTNDGGLLLVGSSSSNILLNNDEPDLTLDFNSHVKIMKLDADFNLVWEKEIGGDFGSQACSVNQDDAGNIYLLGKQISHGNDEVKQYFVLHLNSNGEY